MALFMHVDLSSLEVLLAQLDLLLLHLWFQSLFLPRYPIIMVFLGIANLNHQTLFFLSDLSSLNLLSGVKVEKRTC